MGDKKNINDSKMRLSLLLFVIGILLVLSGYVNQVKPPCEKGVDVRIVPRNVYDQIIEDTIL